MFFIFLFLINSSFAQLAGEIDFTSNFLWRGTTFTQNRPALQGILEYNFPYEHLLGVFASNAEFSDEALGKNTEVTHEIDVYFTKTVSRKNWSMQFTYSYFSFGNAFLFNTDEWNIKFNQNDWMLELSYMDDYFGYQSTYRYIGLEKKITISAKDYLKFNLGYNHFSNRKGSMATRCLDDLCSVRAYGLKGAASSHYFNYFFSISRIINTKANVEFGYNITNRDEYFYDGSDQYRISAQDNSVVVTFNQEI